MDRAKRRRIDKIRGTEEVEYLIEKERKSMKRLNMLDRDIFYKKLRKNKIGKERATKIIDEVYKEL